MPPSRKSETTLDDIANKLDVVIRLLASSFGTDLSLAERAPLLQRAGMDRNEIAAVCNSTPGAVSVRLTEAKGKKGKQRPRNRARARTEAD